MRRLLLWGLILLAGDPGRAAGMAHLLAKLAPVAPFPAVCAAATAAGIPLAGVDPASPEDTLFPGDSVTGLVTLQQKPGRRTQWLLYFEVTTNPPEATAKPEPPLVMYTSTGNRFEFAKSPAHMRVRTLGPFPEPDARRRKTSFDDASAPIAINQGFLGIGLDQGAATVCRWQSEGSAHGGTNFMDVLDVQDKPFSRSRINQDRLLAAQWSVTPEEERSVAGWVPALGSYFASAQATPNLQGILFKVVDLPSLWSFIRHAGMTASLEMQNDEVAPLPVAGLGLPASSAVYTLPMTLLINDHKTLIVTMLVTAPRPPLLTSGGIIGFLGENPADEENYMTLRIISARCAVRGAGKN